MIAKIFINGTIGSTEISKGVELQDVVMQVESQKDATAYHIYINSNGGSIRVGKLIADYIAKLPVAVTIADGFCASMGTEIHLSRPVYQRKITAGTKYLIHNPLMDGISGNADELNEAAEYIREKEKAMLNMYHNATGLSKEALKGLMSQETSLTDEQVVSLGFASEIIPTMELKAVAFIEESKLIKNENKNKMNFKDKVLKAIAGVFDETNAKAMQINTDGGVLMYASEGELPEVNENVTLEGSEEVVNGTFTTESGVQIVVVEGVVTEVIEAEQVDVEALKAELEATKAERDALKASQAEVEENALKVVEVEMAKFKSEFKSKYEPKAEKQNFNKVAKELSVKEQLKARALEIKTKK